MAIDFDAIDQAVTQLKLRKDGPNQSSNDLKIIRLDSNNQSIDVDNIDNALSEIQNVGLYRYGPTLVHVVPSNIKVSGGSVEEAYRNEVVTNPHLREILSKYIHFEKYSKSNGAYGRTPPPQDLAQMYIDRGNWSLPQLLSTITAPSLRNDGTIIDTPGYDAKSGMIYNPGTTKFPPIPINPDQDDAKAALNLIAKPLRFYHFMTPADRAVALSGVLTTLTRCALATAPLHGFDAPTAGSGKSKLVDYASVIATGHAAAVTPSGEGRFSEIEFEKRLSSSILGGDAVISLDNLEDPLSSQLLNQALTQQLVKLRLFGKLTNISAPSVATYFATGNNLVVVGDLNRRSLIARVDPKTERPELESYPFDPVTLARRARPILVVAGLTVLRAYQLAGRPLKTTKPLGGFEDWSHTVREALLWLGEEDPLEVQERSRSSDPRLVKLRDVFQSWARVFDLSTEIFTRELIAKAKERSTPAFSEDSYLVNQDLYDALSAVASASRDVISPDKLGWYFRRNKGRVVRIELDGKSVPIRLYQASGTTAGVRWALERRDDSLIPEEQY